jgi:hypothetical protein
MPRGSSNVLAGSSSAARPEKKVPAVQPGAHVDSSDAEDGSRSSEAIVVSPAPPPRG